MVIQIQPPSSLIRKVLKPQNPREECLYKTPSWVLSHVYKGKKYLFNVLTKELIYLTNLQKMNDIELIQKWFLVPNNFNDYDFVTNIKQLFRLLHKHNQGITNYTIFTTMQCNANCYYCFECGSLNLRLNKKQGKSIINFISQHSNSKPIHLQWFGGEPLMNMPIIDDVCIGLRGNNITYSSTITTNGYLLNNSIITKAINDWNLTKVQITLDGLSDTYNRIKRFNTKEDNPFERVISNIDDLSKAGVSVVVRLNLSIENETELQHLIVFLAEKFRQRYNIRIYVCPIFNLLTEANGPILFNMLNKLQDKIEFYNLGTYYEYFKNNRINHCKADNNGQSIVIFPDGGIGWCEHMWEKHSIGNIDDISLSTSYYHDRWFEYNSINLCKRCILYADCLKLLKCDVNNKCITELIDFDIRRIKDAIVNTVKKYETEI